MDKQKEADVHIVQSPLASFSSQGIRRGHSSFRDSQLLIPGIENFREGTSQLSLASPSPHWVKIEN